MNLLPPLLLALLAMASAGCSRPQADDATAATPGADESEPEAALQSQVGELMRGEGMTPTDGSVLDARPLAGQPEMGVGAFLGSPDGCSDVAKGRACRYGRGGTEVTFIDGMADWVTVTDLGNAPFSAAALARVGLPTTDDPIESTPQFIRWQNLAGYREVTLHAGPGGRAARIEMKMATL